MKRILVIDENRSRMDISVDVFMDLLDTKVETIVRAKDHSLIKTSNFEIRFMVTGEGFLSIRGFKADYVIDGSNNQDIHDYLPVVLAPSKYKR
jgi:hypothetical protein